METRMNTDKSNSIVEVLMSRDGMTRDEATYVLAELRGLVADGEDPEALLADELGLEPDYIDDLIQ
jgi:hypothetical protein